VKTTIKTLAYFVTFILFMRPTLAAMPNDHPRFFPHSGVVTQIDVVNKTIVINDAMFNFNETIKVHQLDSSTGSIYEIRKGNQVGCTFTRDRNGHFTATEIWILADDPLSLPGHY